MTSAESMIKAWLLFTMAKSFMFSAFASSTATLPSSSPGIRVEVKGSMVDAPAMTLVQIRNGPMFRRFHPVRCRPVRARSDAAHKDIAVVIRGRTSLFGGAIITVRPGFFGWFLR